MRFLRTLLLLVLAAPLFGDVTENVQYIPLEKFPDGRAGEQAIPAQPVPPAPTPTPTPVAATCPCAVAGNMAPPGAPAAFVLTVSDIEAIRTTAIANGCTAFSVACPSTYSLFLGCTAPTVATIGYWESVSGQGDCGISPVASVYVPGSITYTGSASATTAEHEACRDALVAVSFYPGFCPTP